MVADTFRRIWQNIYLRVLLIAASAYLFIFILRATRVAWVSFLIAFLIGSQMHTLYQAVGYCFLIICEMALSQIFQYRFLITCEVDGSGGTIV